MYEKNPLRIREVFPLILPTWAHTLQAAPCYLLAVTYILAPFAGVFTCILTSLIVDGLLH